MLLRMADEIEAIRAELHRLGATYPEHVPAIDAIGVRDDGNGNATLLGSPRGIDFHWFGEASEILARLRGLPDNAGPEGIRSEFA